MTKFLRLIILALLVHGVPLVPSCNKAFADWAVSDSYPAADVQPTAFRLYFDGQTTYKEFAPTIDSQGLKYLLYDLTLAGLANGQHTVRAQAVAGTEVSGMTDPVPFTYPVSGISSPSSLGVIKNKPVR